MTYVTGNGTGSNSGNVDVSISLPGITDQPWFSGVSNVFATRGVPVSIWLPIMLGEGANPNAVTQESAGGTSYGLFQLYDKGQGAGYSASALLDPITNATIASAAIARAYQEYGNDIVNVAAYSGHPNTTSSGYQEIYQNIVPWYNKLFAKSGTVVQPSTTTQTQPTQASGGNENGNGSASVQYSFGNGLLHLVIAGVLVVMAIVALIVGLNLIMNGQVQESAKSAITNLGSIEDGV